MALALLDLIRADRRSLRFRIDTGTNRFYQLKFGRGVQRRHDIDWLDDVVHATAIAASRAGGSLFASTTEVAVPAPRVDGNRLYVQLFTYKTRDGVAPAFSSVVTIPMGRDGPIADLMDLPSLGMQMMIEPTLAQPAWFESPRRVECRTYADAFSAPPVIGDLLSQVVQLATPVVLDLLRGAGGGVTPPATGGSTTTGALGTAGAGRPPEADAIAGLVATILGAIPGLAGSTLSGQQSMDERANAGIRFGAPANQGLSRPFIFGIDDALIGAAIGQVIQVLPALANAVNQKRIAIKQADNKLMGDALAGINQRLMLDQVLAAQRQAAPGSQTATDLNQLLQLLQSAQAATPAAPAPATQSLSLDRASTEQAATEQASTSAPSSKAVLAFVTADPVPWNGAPRILFSRHAPMQLRIRLVVAEPSPKNPLPKTILKVVFKDTAGEKVLVEKSVKLKDVAAGAIVAVPFSAEDLAALPADTQIHVLAELRWPSSGGGRTYAALGSTDITLVEKYFVKERGTALSPERELTEMERYRPFWNKVWEAPALDAAAATRGDRKKLLWELNVTGKYTVLLSPEHEANGLMATKVLAAGKDRDSVSERTDGRLKAGIELSITELNKLTPLWDGRNPLDPQKVAAFRTKEFARTHGSELIHTLRLKGKAGERGMVWVIPTFKLYEFTLGAAERADDSGQIVGLAEEKVAFPLPVAARVIGLKAK